MERNCDTCKYLYGEIKPAVIDGPTKQGPWAYMCNECVNAHGYPGSSLNTILANVK